MAQFEFLSAQWQCLDCREFFVVRESGLPVLCPVCDPPAVAELQDLVPALIELQDLVPGPLLVPPETDPELTELQDLVPGLQDSPPPALENAIIRAVEQVQERLARNERLTEEARGRGNALCSAIREVAERKLKAL